MEFLNSPSLTVRHTWHFCLSLAALFVFVTHLDMTTGQIDWDDDDDPGKFCFSNVNCIFHIVFY